MRVRLRLQRLGRKKLPFYRIVAASSIVKRDGKFLDILGLYHPTVKEEASQTRLNKDKILSWLNKGAEPSHTVKKLITQAGFWQEFASEKQKKHEERVKKINKRNKATKKATKKVVKKVVKK